jgi:hypothetical protein
VTLSNSGRTAHATAAAAAAAAAGGDNDDDDDNNNNDLDDEHDGSLQRSAPHGGVGEDDDAAGDDVKTQPRLRVTASVHHGDDDDASRGSGRGDEEGVRPQPLTSREFKVYSRHTARWFHIVTHPRAS